MYLNNIVTDKFNISASYMLLFNGQEAEYKKRYLQIEVISK